jgi:hypothetical protein
VISKLFKSHRRTPVSDIRGPKSEKELLESIRRNRSIKAGQAAKFMSSRDKFSLPKTSPSFPKRRRLVFLFIALVFLGLGIFVFVNIYAFQSEIISSVKKNFGNFQALASKFKFGNPNNDLNLNSISQINLAKNKPFGTDALAKIWPVLKNSLQTYESFQAITANGLNLFNESGQFINNLPDLIFKRQGSELISRLESINRLLGKIRSNNSELAAISNSLSNLSEIDSDFQIPFNLDVEKLYKLSGAILGWLKKSGDHHLLVLLENPSEMRPTGGFVGSYADLVIGGGAIKSIDIHDVNDVDNESDQKIIPPKPIQVIATRFKVADANWFFDFPTSAQKIIQFSEASNLYKKSDITFDGVIAVSGYAINDLLEITGPIVVEIPSDNGSKSKKLTLDNKNFLEEIQRQVQVDRSVGDSYPKKIIQAVTPLLFSKLASLDEAGKQKLFSKFGEWLVDKDLVVYFKDPIIENFLSDFNVSGKIYETPSNFSGDYLAVVNANLGGGKSDLFISQNINLQSQINEDGTISNHLFITREHKGNLASDWWYKVPNQSYIRVFTPIGAQLENFSGGLEKNIKKRTDYSKGSYVSDPTVQEIESTKQEFLNYPDLTGFTENEKNTFATWVKTDPGRKSDLSLSYTERLPAVPKSGSTYRFVFEKQSGVNGDYKFQLSAPIGFRWKENRLPIYEFESKNPPGRLIVDLTFEKITP